MVLYPQTSKIITPPTGDVVSADAFAKYIGVHPVTPQHDTRAAAVEKAEVHMNRKILQQSWVYYYDCLADDFFIPGGFLKEISEIKVTQRDGTSEVIDAGDYDVQFSTDFLSRVMLLESSWPSTDRPGGYEIALTVGWENESKVPSVIKEGILMIADELYTNAMSRVDKMPNVVEILSKYRVYQI